MLDEAYSSEARIDAASEQLKSLSISTYEDGDRTEIEDLEELTKDIEKLAPMAHQQLRSDFS